MSRAFQRLTRDLYRARRARAWSCFPQSVNVAAAASLAGIGLDRTELVVIADPAIDRDQHEVVAEGAFGSLRFEIANVPSDEDPRTGRIVAMSVVRALLDRSAALVIGWRRGSSLPSRPTPRGNGSPGGHGGMELAHRSGSRSRRPHR